MKRHTCRLALAVVIGLLALSLLGGAAAGDSGGSSGAPKSLTNRFPLGTRTLSQSKTAPARGAATTPSRASATTPGEGSTAKAHQPRPTRAAPRHDAHGTSSALFLLVIPALIVVALLGRVLVRMSRRARTHDPDRDRRFRPRVRRRPTRSSGRGVRWTYQDTEDVEGPAPSLPVRERPTPPLPVRERPVPPLPVRRQAE